MTLFLKYLLFITVIDAACFTAVDALVSGEAAGRFWRQPAGVGAFAVMCVVSALCAAAGPHRRAA